jgi:hypothetical protein
MGCFSCPALGTTLVAGLLCGAISVVFTIDRARIIGDERLVMLRACRVANEVGVNTASWNSAISWGANEASIWTTLSCSGWRGGCFPMLVGWCLLKRLGSIPIYLMSFFKFPKWALKLINTHMANS